MRTDWSSSSVNLLTNALTYAPDTERVELRLTREANMALIEVQDQGPGIPDDILPHIFSRFFQTGTARATHGASGGLGLGLFIAQQIVTAHGGTIEATSTLGEGTTFTVRLPLMEVPEAEH